MFILNVHFEGSDNTARKILIDYSVISFKKEMKNDSAKKRAET
jgi:hypothetical protein